jgi:hypothetical protein
MAPLVPCASRRRSLGRIVAVANHNNDNVTAPRSTEQHWG